MRLSYIFSLSFLLGISSLSFSQSTTWPEANASWWVERTMPHGLLLPHPTDPNIKLVKNGMLTTQIYYELGDTVTINGLLYTELWQDHESHFESFSGDTMVDYPLTGAPTVRGFFRSDISKVYFKESPLLAEELLYDFDLSVGDTLPPSFINHKPNPVVDSIATVLIEGVAHRKFYLNGAGVYYDVIIEGVGNKNGPIQELGIGFDINHRIICYTQNGIASYPDTGAACSNGPTFIGEFDHFEKVTISPNPIVNEALIYLPSKEVPHSFQLFNYNGQLMRTGRVKLSSNRKFTLKRSGLKNGYYLLHIKYESGKTTPIKVLFMN